MSARVHIFGLYDPIRIERESRGVVWIRCGSDAVSLNLTPEQREELRAALDDSTDHANLLNDTDMLVRNG